MFLDANLAELQKVQPALADELRRQPAARNILLMPIQDRIADGDAVIVVGLPAPDTWANLLGSRTPVLIVSHPQLPDLRSYLTLVDLHGPISTGRVSFAVGDEGVLQLLNDLFGTLYRRRITVYGEPGTAGHDATLKEMRFFDTLCASNRATLDQFAEEWQNHISENLKDFLAGPFLEDERGIWAGSEAVVAAAGPSLDEVKIPDDFKGRPVVVCDTAAPVVALRGIVPDLIVTLDSSVSNQAYLRNLPKDVYDRSILCATPLVSRAVYRQFRNVLFYSYGHPTLDHLKECSGVPFEPLATGGSVALTAVDVVRMLGARRAYLIGFDFQYYRFRTHARGTGAALRGIPIVTRIAPIEQVVYDYQNELEVQKSDGPARSREALTDQKFQKWRDWLELYVKTNDLELVQMSSSCAPIAGVPIGAPSGTVSVKSPAVRRREFGPELQRELKFLAKELEMAAAAPPEELLRRVLALPRVSKCLGYVLAWLSDKSPEEARRRLKGILDRFRSGVTAAISGQGL